MPITGFSKYICPGTREMSFALQLAHNTPLINYDNTYIFPRTIPCKDFYLFPGLSMP